MNEQNLKGIVQISIAALKDLRKKLNSCTFSEPDQIIQAEVYDTWNKRVSLENELSDVLFLIECRDVQKGVMEDLRFSIRRLPESEKIEKLVNYGNCQCSLKVMRNLVVTTHLGSVWAIYDKLSNVVGRLLGGDEILKNQLLKENPKLIGSFISSNNAGDNKKNITMMSINAIISRCFREHIALSYLLRNCFIHEGGTIGKGQIFTGKTVNTAFYVNEDIAQKLNYAIAESYGVNSPTIARSGDLLEQLESCHKQIDKCFSGLLQFAVGSLKLQIDAFMALDNYD